MKPREPWLYTLDALGVATITCGIAGAVAVSLGPWGVLAMGFGLLALFLAEVIRWAR